MSVLIVDFETTGLFQPKATEFGMVQLDKDFNLIESGCHNSRIDPEKEISWGAMGVTGITNESVKGCPTIEQTFKQVDCPDVKYIASHNLQFDKQFLPDGWVPDNVRFICTLKVAKKLIDKKQSDDHKNSTLYYYLGSYKDPIGKGLMQNTHSALTDALMTATNIRQMCLKYNLTLKQLWQISEGVTEDNPVKVIPDNDITICPFKKHEGRLWVDVIRVDRDYIYWLLSSGKIKCQDTLAHVKKYFYG
jgi:DNA polymerase III epsilon subunit-like protein